MPWKAYTPMSLRFEFVKLVLVEGCCMAELCRRYEVSRKTGYKWVKRFLHEGAAGLADRSRRPKSSPRRSCDAIENEVKRLRGDHPAWGGRKLRVLLQERGFQTLPAASTITAILRRHGLLEPSESTKHKAWQQFEAATPNDLWQMDFKGHFAAGQGRCHPLTVLDDHSRFSLVLQACPDEQSLTVQQRLILAFRRFGLPRRMLMDNGAPWGSDATHIFSPLTVWLIRQGIRVIHSRSFHPQTLGKDERFHRTFKAEVGQYCLGLSLCQCQLRFDRWRDVYNFQRPHEALNMQVPGSRYSPSRRPYQESLPPIEYGPTDQVRKVQQGGWISFQGKAYRLPQAFYGQRVALRAVDVDGLFEVYFCNQKIAQVNQKNHEKVLPMSPNTCYP